ncbi:MAG TPA: phosphotransferase [Actinomycetota bacterium]|nr:phosphotransferase [Actinomycetota bacterium]
MDARGDPRLEAAIGAVEAWRGQDIGLTPAASGEGERRFLVEVSGEVFVLRVASPAAPRGVGSLEVEVEIMRAAAAAGVTPEVVTWNPSLGCLVTRTVSGRQVSTADAPDLDVLASVVGSIRALHACPLPGVERSVFRDADDLRRAALARGVAMPSTEPAATEAVRRLETAIEARTHRRVPCHGDLRLEHLFLEGERVWITEFHHAGAGDAFEDLGSVAAHLALSQEQSEAMLTFYFGQADDDTRCDLTMARAAADYLIAMRSLAEPSVVRHMQTVQARLGRVAAAAAEAGVG